MLKLIPLGISALIFVSCARPLTGITSSNVPDSIQLCTSFGERISLGLQNEIDRTINRFIADHNTSSAGIKFTGCVSNNDFLTINFAFDSTVYVRKKQNIAATAGNVLGLVVLPVGMVAAGSEFFMGIYFWPNTRTNMEVSTSGDFESSPWPEFPSLLKTPGYLNSIEKQNIKQGEGFYRILNFWFRKIEKQELIQDDISRL